MALATYTGSVRWAGDLTKCLDVQGGRPLTGAQVGLWACRAEHPNQQFSWSSGGRIQWVAYPSFCLHGSRLGGAITLERCALVPAAVPVDVGNGYKAICLNMGWHCLKVEVPGSYALDGTPVKLMKMPPEAAFTFPWVFQIDASCSGEIYCPQLADCYEECRLSGAFDQVCWKTSCCPSVNKEEYNHSSYNYYVCTFANPCMKRCNLRFQSQRCDKDGQTYCPSLANCYEACRLQKRVGDCRDLSCCPKQVQSFNESIEDFYRCAVGNTCLTSCNEVHDAQRYCDGRSYCPQLAKCYQECHTLGLASELCSSSSTCCPTFAKHGASRRQYADPDLGYYICDDGVACLERCNGRFAYEEPNSLQSRHIPRPDVLQIIAQLQPPEEDNAPASPLVSAILVISVLLLFVAAMLVLLQRRKQIPTWTGPIGRFMQRHRLGFLAVEEELPEGEQDIRTLMRHDPGTVQESGAEHQGILGLEETRLPENCK